MQYTGLVCHPRLKKCVRIVAFADNFCHRRNYPCPQLSDPKDQGYKLASIYIHLKLIITWLYKILIQNGPKYINWKKQQLEPLLHALRIVFQVLKTHKNLFPTMDRNFQVLHFVNFLKKLMSNMFLVHLYMRNQMVKLKDSIVILIIHCVLLNCKDLWYVNVCQKFCTYFAQHLTLQLVEHLHIYYRNAKTRQIFQPYVLKAQIKTMRSTRRIWNLRTIKSWNRLHHLYLNLK